MTEPRNIPHVRDKRDKNKPFNPQRKKKKALKHKQKKVEQTHKKREHVFVYLCQCHEEKAKKTPCERSHEDRAQRRFSVSPLGTWRCSVTNHKCKVRRVKQAHRSEHMADIMQEAIKATEEVAA